MPSSLVNMLQPYGEGVAIVRQDAEIPARELLRQGEELASELRRSAFSSVLLASEDAAQIVSALTACDMAGKMLMLGPGSLDDSQVQQITSEYGVGGLLCGSDCALSLVPTGHNDRGNGSFDVALMTSGTSGNRKIARHSLASLMGRIKLGETRDRGWLLTYTPTGFAGMQVILTALAGSSRLVCPNYRQLGTMIPFAADKGVTHASGTPTFWRAWLLASVGMASIPNLEQITIGGEAVDQVTLDHLANAYPSARITHIYASTEAGSVFSVSDKREGFPASWLTSAVEGIHLRITDGVLEIRTPRRMSSYLSRHSATVSDDGWLCTGDLVRIEDDRVVFCGRQDKMINVAGFKVFPEDVERALLRVGGVVDAYVYAKPNVITGNVLLADIICEPLSEANAVVEQAKAYLRGNLPRHQLPAMIRVVKELKTAESGKKQR